ncbi:DUF4309 domain-containing protein [Paenibacillus sp. HN-1]|nr:DUF4309 domain-containing protein [Paenibacillus sp. CGMCC 1.18879]MBY9087171.1 DUF4309 domain-containing protein [Paenibacillus sinensis]
MLGLSACSSGGNGAAGASAAPAVTASPAGGPAAGGHSAAPSESAATGGTAGASAPAQASAEPSAADTGGQSVQSQLQELMELAKQGHAPGIPFAAHTGMIEDVKAAWGKPDIEEGAGKGIYATYKAKQAVIGFNKGSVIIDVRSSADELHRLTLQNIEASLGNPDEITTSGSDHIYTYKAGEQYQLKFVIPEQGGTVDHISVYSPGDAVNNMAG